jgi:Glyoxalase-like domain
MVALDCPDPLALAEFYSALTGEPVMDHEGWPPEEIPGIDLMPVSGPRLSFSRVESYVAPTWPDGGVPKQMHLDFLVDDLDEGEAWALSLGATKPAHQPGEHFRVFLDPVGHPFCLIDAATFE